MGGTLVPTVPGEEAAALDAMGTNGDHPLDSTSVIMVGERLATSPGALSAAAGLAARTGAPLAWVPRRAGDRGAIETGCLPNLLPGGRPVADAAARVDVAAAWGVETLPEAPGRDGDADRRGGRTPASSAARRRWRRPRRHRGPGCLPGRARRARSWSRSSCARPT